MPKPTENPVEAAPLLLGVGAGVAVVELLDSALVAGDAASGAMEGAAEERLFLALISTC
jgi:hypothetical protein